MTDFTEQAREFRLEHGYPWCGECDLDRVCSGCEPMLKPFAAALTAAYKQGLEEAAKVCDKNGEGIFCGCEEQCHEMDAAAIRALKEKR